MLSQHCDSYKYAQSSRRIFTAVGVWNLPQKVTLVTSQKHKDCLDEYTLKFPIPIIFQAQPLSKQAGALGNVAFPFGLW